MQVEQLLAQTESFFFFFFTDGKDLLVFSLATAFDSVGI